MPIFKVVFRIYYNQKGEYATLIFSKNIYFQQKGEYDIRMFTKNIFCIELLFIVIWQ